jgi:hypothetical protein
MAGWLAAPAGGGFDARSVTDAADEIERLRAEVEARRSLDKVRLETIRHGLTEMRHLQALIDAYAAAFKYATRPKFMDDRYRAAHHAILAAATPKEDDRA